MPHSIEYVQDFRIGDIVRYVWRPHILDQNEAQPGLPSLIVVPHAIENFLWLDVTGDQRLQPDVADHRLDAVSEILLRMPFLM
jgi:hypothetical protein